MKNLILIFILLVASLCTIFTARYSFAQDNKMVFQDFDGSTPPKNNEGVGYPTYYQSSNEGGPLNISVDVNKKIGGASSLRLRLISGSEFYPQWNPWDGTTRDFARSYSANPADWKFNTFNRFRFWFWISDKAASEKNDGTQNYYLGSYVKRVTDMDPYSDETGGGHYYHPFNVLRNAWSMCTFNSHPGHERGQNGGTDTGNIPYPTTPEYGGSGDPANTYNYFDTLTRFYIQEGMSGGSFPRDYWIDEMEFYKEPYRENDEQVYSICVSYTAKNNRIFLTWNRPKSENSIKHEVKYAFSNIHALGWSNATPAPNGTIAPPGWQGYNGMVYDTTAINVSGKSLIYLAIKPQNSNLFSQVALPLVNGFALPSLTAPTNLKIIP